MNSTVKIICAGDFSPRDKLAELVETDRFIEVLGEVRPIISAADYAVVNLESPVVIDSTARPIDKIGPNLRCTPKCVDALTYAGFNMATLANNHFYDYGDKGVIDTLMTCANKLDVVGGGTSLGDAMRPFRKVIKDRIFTFINCCEHEFSIATNKTGGSNPLNPFVVYNQIQEAQKQGDKIIVIVHGGRELFQYPTIRMKELYHFFIDAGAHVVINHHQHCYCGYEKYNKGLIFYGLGNFCFYNKRYSHTLWNNGYLVEVSFNDDDLSFQLYPYEQCSDTISVKLLKGSELETFNKIIWDLSMVIQDDEKLDSMLATFVWKPDKNPLVTFEPFTNHVLAALRRRKLIPSLLTKKKKELIKAKIMCESHRDCILKALQ